MITLKTISKMVWPICIGLALSVAQAQPAEPPAEAPGMVTLNLPEEVDLKVLVDYVGKRQGINFIYDEQIAGKKVSIKANQKVPADSLLALLESALKMKGLTMSLTEVPGMLRIEPVKQLAAVSSGIQKPTDAADPAQTGVAVTRVFDVKHATQQRIDQVVQPFLSVATANITVLPDLGLVVVTDYATNMKKIEELIALVDRPGRKVAVRFAAVKNVDATAVATKLKALVDGKAKVRGTAANDPSAGLTVLADERTNQLAILGPESEVDDAMVLLEALDAPLGLETKVYTFVAAAPDQVDRLVKSLIGELAAKRLYRSTIDRDSNLLVVAATPEIHKQIQSLRESLDKPMQEAQSPIRFYKLKNAKAADVLLTLEGIEGETGLQDASVDGMTASPKPENIIAYKGPTEADVNATATREGEQPAFRARGPVQLRDARIMADEPSNTIIVIAKPSMHVIYEKLIHRLDERRPQVLVEATVIAMDTTDGFQLGVEISQTGSVNNGEGKLLNFDSFGLSQVDPNTGALTIKPGLGFNGALISADIANIVIRALESNSRVKVLSRPSVLINDNATGKLASQNEEPFATALVVGAGQPATTTFGGFASAGTSIDITPQISEGEHLKVKYKIELSSFSDTTTTATLPPARQKNTLESEATIPDGFTIVIGGLTRESYRNAIDRVPILGRIPVVEYLFSSRTTDKTQATLFIFIRAVILRDDQFADLKAVSGAASHKTELPAEDPASEPLEIR